MYRKLAVVGLAAVGFVMVGYLWFNPRNTEVSGSAFIPEGHFRTFAAAQIAPEAAEAYYEGLRREMASRYGESGFPAAMAYQDWTRFNRTPYLSATHGERYVNNYGNALAEGYGDLWDNIPLPEGAILAKDAFAVTRDGNVFGQSLSLMEKLAPGASPSTGDWRYIMITPAGEIYGDSAGANPEKVRFCHECHEQAVETDYLFDVPPAFRDR